MIGMLSIDSLIIKCLVWRREAAQGSRKGSKGGNAEEKIGRWGGGGRVGAKHKGDKGSAGEKHRSEWSGSGGKAWGGGKGSTAGGWWGMGASTRGGLQCCGKRREAPKRGEEAQQSSHLTLAMLSDPSGLLSQCVMYALNNMLDKLEAYVSVLLYKHRIDSNNCFNHWLITT